MVTKIILILMRAVVIVSQLMWCDALNSFICLFAYFLYIHSLSLSLPPTIYLSNHLRIYISSHLYVRLVGRCHA